MDRILTTTAVSALALAALGTGAAAQTVVTMNTVQIFGTIDPANISDYTDHSPRWPTTRGTWSSYGT